MRTLSNRTGFSLVEVLASITIFALVAAGLAASTVATIRGNLSSRDITAATSLAQARIEFFRSLDPAVPAERAQFVSGGDGCDASCCSTMPGCTATNHRFARTWTVTPMAGGAGVPSSAVALVEVAVTWITPQPSEVRTVAYMCVRPGCS